MVGNYTPVNIFRILEADVCLEKNKSGKTYLREQAGLNSIRMGQFHMENHVFIIL